MIVIYTELTYLPSSKEGKEFFRSVSEMMDYALSHNCIINRVELFEQRFVLDKAGKWWPCYIDMNEFRRLLKNNFEVDNAIYYIYEFGKLDRYQAETHKEFREKIILEE